MDMITRNVDDLSASELRVYEAAFGRPLSAGEQIVMQVVEHFDGGPTLGNPSAPACGNGDAHQQLPDWLNVFDGLSDKEVEETEQSILARCHSSRAVDVDF